VLGLQVPRQDALPRRSWRSGACATRASGACCRARWTTVAEGCEGARSEGDYTAAGRVRHALCRRVPPNAVPEHVAAQAEHFVLGVTRHACMYSTQDPLCKEFCMPDGCAGWVLLGDVG